MKFVNPVTIIIKSQIGEFKLEATQARVNFDDNSFRIEGIFQPNKIKVSKENLRGSRPKTSKRNKR